MNLKTSHYYLIGLLNAVINILLVWWRPTDTQGGGELLLGGVITLLAAVVGLYFQQKISTGSKIIRLIVYLLIAAVLPFVAWLVYTAISLSKVIS